MKLHRLRWSTLAAGLFIPLIACVGGGRPAAEALAIPVTALTSGTHAAVVVVTVNASDTSLERRIELHVKNGIAEGMISIEPGVERLVSARVYDTDGFVTHAGNILFLAYPGEEPYTTVRMSPRVGEPPLALWLGAQVHHAYGTVSLAGTD